ncbi:Ribosomal silencing factor RsfS [Rickettsiales endosymbiont of Paramecium tredecaurelia]|uniref:ribosome silencing factor n=1 Tax=Candidatus Sarmatiella mevalonica TaxID=2770581 RepID=UPI00192306C8|nr:ribosome silencing factor [Candidatus Sarmatiella mevalonica]MBL3284538.1 Ribosomal silencing factor RsfS [Candidatus Sarmatiella mevalonica]
MTLNSKDLLGTITSFLEERKLRDISYIDVRDKTPITDYMVFATATSSKHAFSAAEALAMMLKQSSITSSTSGDSSSTWILLDTIGVMTHILCQERRIELDLEGLWSSTTNTK